MYSKSNINNYKKRRNSRGFSLVELLVVIGIIVILVGIMMPSLNQIRMRAYKTKSVAAITELNAGALQYKNDNKYYPGQKIKPASGITGSQLLSAALLDNVAISGSNLVAGTGGAKGNYVGYNADNFATISSKAFTPTDRWKSNDVMPILYFPSRMGNEGTISTAFVNGDNSSYYTSTNYKSSESLADAILDNRFGGTNKAYNSDTFLLFGASVDRQFYTNDDVKNF